MTPAKALKADAALMMQTSVDDAAWVTRCHAATERLKAKEATVKASVSAQEGTGIGDAAWEPKWVETAPSAARLDEPGSGGPEPARPRHPLAM
jgi:hypothetical protein